MLSAMYVSYCWGTQIHGRSVIAVYMPLDRRGLERRCATLGWSAIYLSRLSIYCSGLEVRISGIILITVCFNGGNAYAQCTWEGRERNCPLSYY